MMKSRLTSYSGLFSAASPGERIEKIEMSPITA